MPPGSWAVLLAHLSISGAARLLGCFGLVACSVGHAPLFFYKLATREIPASLLVLVMGGECGH